MAARTIPERVCVLVGRQEFRPFRRVCLARDHGHMTGTKAQATVVDDSATWEREVWTDGHGREHKRTLPAIRLVGRRRWKGVPSGYPPERVMQLVSS